MEQSKKIQSFQMAYGIRFSTETSDARLGSTWVYNQKNFTKMKESYIFTGNTTFRAP